jgi:hypothetical protein
MRALAPPELKVLSFLAGLGGIEGDFLRLQVESLSDGGMGSFRIGILEGRHFGGMASECYFQDSDGVLVLASLNLDQNGDPFEVDIWKVDFAPLQSWPTTVEMKPGRPNP